MQGQRTTGVAGATETEGVADSARPARADNCPSLFFFFFLKKKKKRNDENAYPTLVANTHGRSYPGEAYVTIDDKANVSYSPLDARSPGSLGGIVLEGRGGYVAYPHYRSQPLFLIVSFVYLYDGFAGFFNVIVAHVRVGQEKRAVWEFGVAQGALLTQLLHLVVYLVGRVDFVYAVHYGW